ncbi:SDR family NAD(P)-dependent oxidoreductase [Micromonospora sp. WMMD812]|uniref:SDR family NAD(P)-dependent oxidoreductase n=1 Tax=Micromonospora sp. WMMD812 TaxID=3015152 RepID=UPI00248BE3B6|nr:SDR family NAD(P)-dependent oxidoreductase [Micromonospora sp. WMMD812]WBB69056.1 SDR family NAD(P)-dependent oxidoreductase [Micromonospora sp. WMMD812]
MIDPLHPFAGKVALVTGAGTGIGRATAEQLAREGGTVILVGRRSAPLEEVAAGITATGGTAHAFPADVSDPAQVANAVTFAVERCGALHLAVNNAGVSGGHARLVDLSVDDYRQVMGVNLDAVFFGMKYQIPAIIAAGGGAIVNVSSVDADRGHVDYAAYTATKHAVRGVTRAAALENATTGVRINELQPGVIATPLSQTDPEATARAEAKVPMRRSGRPAETAEAICFLLSERASYITGTHFSVDGGFLA